MEKNIIGIMKGVTTSKEKAEKQTKSMKNCPYLLSGGYTSNQFNYVFILTVNKKWWLEYPASNPEIVGAKNIHLELIDNVIKPDEFTLILPKVKTKISPCGSSCKACPMRLEQCTGCPATIYSESD